MTTKLYSAIETSYERRALGDDNDCAIISLAIAADIKYVSASKLLDALGREWRVGSTMEAIYTAASLLGLDVEDEEVSMSLEEAAKEYNSGSYLVELEGHVLAMVDGIVHDYSEDMSREVMSVAELK